MAVLSSAEVLRRLGLEEPGLFCAFWERDEEKAAELAEDLVSSGLGYPPFLVKTKLLEMHDEFSRELHQRLRSFSTMSDLSIEVEMRLKKQRLE
jgi:hypothetical protein